MKLKYQSGVRMKSESNEAKKNRASIFDDQQRGHSIIVSSGIPNSSFRFTANVEKTSREFCAAAGWHGVFLCRGGHFASIDMARTSILAGQQQQRNEFPAVLMNHGEHSAGLAMELQGNSRVSAQNAFV